MAAAEGAGEQKDSHLGHLRVGTAGFTSSHWSGRFYPPSVKKGEDQLECYQESFNTVEVNSTFYGIPSAETVANWQRRAARGFQFALKLPKTVTHEGPLASEGALSALRFFLERTAPLHSALGPLLFQFPRTAQAHVEGLQRIAAVLDAQGSCRVAVEFRNRSAVTDPDVIGFLRAKGWALVQHPNTLDRATAANAGDAEMDTYPLESLGDTVTADFAYVRLHGDNDAHNYCYKEEELAEYARVLHSWRQRGLDVYCILLNDTDSAAMPRNAQRLLQIVHGLAGEAVPRGPKLAKQRSLTSFFTPAKKAKQA